MDKASLSVKGMSCMGCVNSVKNVLEPMTGVNSVAIVLDPGQVTVEFDPALVTLEQIRNTINDAGYEVVS